MGQPVRGGMTVWVKLEEVRVSKREAVEMNGLNSVTPVTEWRGLVPSR